MSATDYAGRRARAWTADGHPCSGRGCRSIADELEFQLATFKWLAMEFGGAEQAQLVLPTPEFFPLRRGGGRGGGRIETLFDHVRRAAGMADWPCELRAGREDRPIEAGNTLLLRHEGAAAPCGTFQVRSADGPPKVVITYNPSLAADSGAMVATFAHELGHYLMSTAASRTAGRLGAARAPHRSRRRLARIRHLPRQQRAQLQPVPERRRDRLVVAHPGLSERRSAGHRAGDLPAPSRRRSDRAFPLAEGLSAHRFEARRRSAGEASSRHVAAAVDAVDLSDYAED